MDCIVHAVAKSWIRLSDFHFHFLSLHTYTYIYTYITHTHTETWASLVAQIVKNLPAMRETQVPSLGQEDPLEKGMAIHSSSLTWTFH